MMGKTLRALDNAARGGRACSQITAIGLRYEGSAVLKRAVSARSIPLA